MDCIKNAVSNALVELVNPGQGSTLPTWAVAVAVLAIVALVGRASIGDFIY